MAGTKRSGPMAKNNLLKGGPGQQATAAGLALRGEPADVGKRLNGLAGSKPGPNQASRQPLGNAKTKQAIAGIQKRGSTAGNKAVLPVKSGGPKRSKVKQMASGPRARQPARMDMGIG